MIKVCLIGTGNVAWHFGQWLPKSGIHIIQVYGRTLKDAKQFAEDFKCDNTNDIAEITKKADIYLLCINDDAIVQFMKNWSIKLSTNQILIHTSGSVGASAFREFHHRYACIWPIQSLTKGLASDPEKIPFVVSTSNKETEKFVVQFMDAISKKIITSDDETKSKMHFMAVMVNNFTNHIFTLVEDYGKAKNIDFTNFIPLIKSTVIKLEIGSASENQTGPARRNDVKTINHHIKNLDSHPELMEVYKVLSQSIINKYQNK